MISSAKTALLTALALAAFVAGGSPLSAQNEGDDWGDDWDEAAALPVEIHGFVEAASAGRVVDDETQADDLVLSEARFRLDLAHYGERAEVYFKGDFLSDALTSGVDIDLRQAVLKMRASSWLDVRAGRQVLTWGTGDLVFLNDLFPKDFVSFFTGRDDEFLKAPSNSIKLTFYSGLANADLVWTPVFAPDRYITGERLSFFSPPAGTLVSALTMGGPLTAYEPQRDWDNGEVAGRLFRTIKGYELALYGYLGFSKQPLGFDAARGTPVFSPLSVYGTSLRGNLLGGIASLEGAYYDSRRDRCGEDPTVPNSQARGLAGYERELFAQFTTGVQYYAEWIDDHEELIANSANDQAEPEEVRHLLTARLTYRLSQETLTLSSFVFYSPNQQDGHVRPAITYKWSDAVTMAAGANVMFGGYDTFFGQLENNNNLYVRLRYSF